MDTKAQPWLSKTVLFLSSQAVSLVGSQVVGYAITWHLTLSTSSSVIMMIAVLCTTVPQVIVSLFGGVFADRYNRKYLIMGADLFIAVATLTLAILFFSGIQPLWMIFLVLGVRSIGAGIQTPAVSALLPQLVPEEHLMRVNGINNSAQTVFMLLAPAIGGLLLGTTGLSLALLVDVFTALVAIGIMCFLRVKKHEITQTPKSMFGDLVHGLKYVKERKVIKYLLVFYLFFAFFMAPAAFLTPLMIERSFGPEVWRLTLNELIWSVGSLIGGLIIAKWGGWKNRITTMAVTTVIFGILFSLLGLSRIFWVYLAFMGLAGIFMPMAGTAMTVLVQEEVEADMMGRVFSLIQIMGGSAMPLGMLVFGPLGDRFRIESLLIVSGVCLVILGLIVLKMRAIGDPKPQLEQVSE